MKKAVIFFSIIMTLLLVTACSSTEDVGVPTTTPLIDETIIFTPRDDLDTEVIREKDEKLPYTIYSCGGDVEIIIDGKPMSLVEALDENKITIDKILNKATNDVDEGIAIGGIYRDGGSRTYTYSNYSIIKCNKLDGNRDLYIGKSGMDINDLF